MKQEVEFSICRPAQDYWCVECCTQRADGTNPCCNLGKLSDGSRGCLGHITIDNPVLPQTQFCIDNSCISESLNNSEDLNTIRQAILVKPPGEFKMSDFLSK
jgi:hypothetical protein